ncbi:MAG: glycosyltransferase [Pseudomonadota bacterium]
MNNKPVKVSVTVVTYNQVNYIGECLESIVTQQTNFPFEVIVGDDCSTDGAVEIIKQYVAKYPELIKAIFHEKNTLTIDKSNFRDVVEAARGEYIAHIDGDDLMLPGKLQKQVDFLDNHPECCVCHHDMEIISPDGSRKGKGRINLLWDRKKVMGLSEVLEYSGGRIHSSRMYRVDSIPQSGFIYDVNMRNLDFIWLVQLLVHSPKKVGYLDEILGKYRVGVGVSSNPNYKYLGLAGSLKGISLAEESGLVEMKILNKVKSETYIWQARFSLLGKDYANFVNYMKKSQDYSPLGKKDSILYGMRHFPWLARLLLKIYKKLTRQVS